MRCFRDKGHDFDDKFWLAQKKKRQEKDIFEFAPGVLRVIII